MTEVKKLFADGRSEGRSEGFWPRWPPTSMKQNIRDLKICLLTNFHRRTTLGGRKNAEKPKPEILKK